MRPFVRPATTRREAPVAEPYTEQEIQRLREWFLGTSIFDGGSPRRWLATLDAERKRTEGAEAARDNRDSVIKTIKEGIYGHLGREPRHGYCVIAEVGELVKERDELECIFDLNEGAYLRAVELFRKAHPDYPELRYPDKAKLFAWIASDRDRCIEERDTLRDENDKLRGLLCDCQRLVCEHHNANDCCRVGGTPCAQCEEWGAGKLFRAIDAALAKGRAP